MARIPAHSRDHRLGHAPDAMNPRDGAHASPGSLLDRREESAQDADADRIRARGVPVRLLAIVPARSYLEISG